MGIAKKPNKKQAFNYLYNQSVAKQGYPYMMQGYCEGKWYLDGFVVTKGDWIALRMLYLMLALDPSNINIAEVKNVYGYYVHKFSEDGVTKLLGMLKQDYRAQKSFEKTPDSRAIREFHKTLNDGKDEYEDITPTIQSSVVSGAR